MVQRTLIEDLFGYNDWAHERIFRLCAGLTDQQLDQSRAMGFGTLRGTLFHILTAEQIWLERWNGAAVRPFPTDPAGVPLAEIASGLERTAAERQRLLDHERASNWTRVVSYRDSKGNPHSNVLEDLLLHVANHAIHHRAQALSFLKSFGRTVPGGIDYIFFRLARPTVFQEDATVAALRGFGLEVGTMPGADVDWEPRLIRRYFDYHDWANAQLIDRVADLEAALLDRDFAMGPGSLRKTLLHLHDAENWWINNWTQVPASFVHSAAETPIDWLRESWSNIASRRNAFVSTLNSDDAQRLVSVLPGGPSGPPTNVKVIESLIQLCGHGTHHRAQLINMVRQTGLDPPALDFIVWLRQ